MPSLDHTHSFVKYKRRPGFWRCAHPHCNCIIDEEAVLGKACVCPLCGDEFILTREDLRRVKPRCPLCSDTPKGRAFKEAQKIATLFTLEEKKEEKSDTTA